MSDLATLAARNHADRMAQIARLRPRYTDAKARAEELYQARKGVKDLQAGVELMSKLKHVPNFFPTPRDLVAKMIARARVPVDAYVLEPSAGKGDIAEALRNLSVTVHCIELVHSLAEVLRGKGFDTMCADFLDVHPDPRNMQKFDRVIMNPPFERGVDEDHILHAFKFLKPGGMLVSVACSTTGSKLESWADDHLGWVEQLPTGTFARSERPTNVNTCLITATK